MARLTIYKDNYADSTIVSNCFIDEFMKDANDAQLKVYLYLIRMLNASQATSVSDIADKFNHTEKDVLRALRYWEQKKLLSLDYDNEKNLVGIHMRDLTRREGVSSAAMSPFFSLNSSKSEQIQTKNQTLPTPGKESEDHTEDNSISGTGEPMLPLPPAKPNFSLDQLKEFKSRESTAQLLFITESYIGKPLTPGEMKSILYFKDVLHFTDDLIDYLIQYCVDRGKKDFKYIERVAVNWAEEGITTPKEAEESSARYDRNVYTIMNMLGKSNAPTPREVAYIKRWTGEYGFTNDIILEACERTVMATDKHRFEYAEGILSSWKRQDVHHKADIRLIDDLYQQKRKSSSKQSGVNKFNQFTQNHYDFDELEKELLSN